MILSNSKTFGIINKIPTSQIGSMGDEDWNGNPEIIGGRFLCGHGFPSQGEKDPEI